MASDTQFNRKSCTTGHTGFGVPFANWPDRSDVPRSAARPLRYMDRYVTVTQGEVMCITELLEMCIRDRLSATLQHIAHTANLTHICLIPEVNIHTGKINCFMNGAIQLWMHFGCKKK